MTVDIDAAARDYAARIIETNYIWLADDEFTKGRRASVADILAGTVLHAYLSRLESEPHPAAEFRGRPFAELRPTGVLWLCNRVAFHPRGFALALHFDSDDGSGPSTGWSLIGGGAEPFLYGPDMSEDESFRAVEALLDDTAAANR